MSKKILILSPFENIMTKRGNRHPLIADLLQKEGYDLTYITTNFYHADKTFFSENFVEYWTYFIGALYVIVVMFLPLGLAGILGKLRGSSERSD